MAVNADPVAPHEDGLSPAAGGIVAALAVMAGRQPALIVGKPSARMVVEALRRAGTASQDTLLIGDTVASDIRGGVEVGLATALVLTGNTTAEKTASAPILPDYLPADLGQLEEERETSNPGSGEDMRAQRWRLAVWKAGIPHPRSKT